MQAGQSLASLFFLPSFFFLVYDIASWPVYPWLLRRFVPVLVPFLLVSVAFTLMEPHKCFGQLWYWLRSAWQSLKWQKKYLSDTEAFEAWRSLFSSPRWRKIRPYFLFSTSPTGASALLSALFVGGYISPATSLSAPIIREKPYRNMSKDLSGLAERIPDHALVVVDEELKGNHIAPVLAIVFGKRVLVIQDNAATSAAHPSTTAFLKEEHDRNHPILFLTATEKTRFESGQFYPSIFSNFPLSRSVAHFHGDAKGMDAVTVRKSALPIKIIRLLPGGGTKSTDVLIAAGQQDKFYLTSRILPPLRESHEGSFRSLAPAGSVAIPQEAGQLITEITAKVRSPQNSGQNHTSQIYLYCYVNGELFGGQSISKQAQTIRFPSSEWEQGERENLASLPGEVQSFANRTQLNLGPKQSGTDRIDFIAVTISPSPLAEIIGNLHAVEIEGGAVQVFWMFIRRAERSLPARIDIGSPQDLVFIDRAPRQFYDREEYEDSDFRWFQPSASIDLSHLLPQLARDGRYRIRIQVPDIVPDWILRVSQVHLGSRPLLRQVVSGPNEATVSGEHLLRTPLLHLVAPGWRPYDYYGGVDKRLLGLPVEWIEITPLRNQEDLTR
jgi:hypothetical protein